MINSIDKAWISLEMYIEENIIRCPAQLGSAHSSSKVNSQLVMYIYRMDCILKFQPEKI